MLFSEIIDKLGKSASVNSLSVYQNLNPEITQLAAIDEAYEGSISYVEGAKFQRFINETSASALILPLDEDLHKQATKRNISWISTSDPRLLFAQTIALFYQPWQPSPGIHPTAVIHPTAKIGSNVHIGAHVVIEERAELGNDVCIHPNVVIYPEVQIGDRTIIHANCTIHERSQIGTNCVINSGTVIGAEGFGFVPTATGWEKMHQSGYTVLEDGVEVGCNSAIDRPAVGETRIGKNTIIDNLVQIGHGCKIGSGCALAGQSGMAGGVKIGNRVILAGQAGIANQVKLGDGAIATAQAGVHSDVAPGEIVSGSPAISNKLYVKAFAVFNRLPQMYQTFRKVKSKFDS
ncbi:MAG: UDP-3-O-(3-hydroxymyristoyl)glucosamine N-acyltransferase [Cyanobacteria bacterium P01_A01_bin.45]